MAQAMGYTNGREKLIEYDPLNEELPENDLSTSATFWMILKG